MKFTLYQVRIGRICEVAFRPFNPRRKIDRCDYRDTFNGIIAEEHSSTDDDALKWLYLIFNTAHPRNFNSYSMSMADIVALDQDRIYYCDTVGWRRLQSSDVINGNF
jgi:hypothetical protein